MALRPRRHNAAETPAPPATRRPAQAVKRSDASGAPYTFFLRTKLLPPRPTPELLSRPRLTERLLANLAHSVTLVTANAGSGKTTLVADFVRQHARQFVWYQLDHTDDDPYVFLGYLAHGIKQLVPHFGEVIFSYLEQSADEVARQPERAVDVLLNEVLDKVERQLILVLDDYHHLGTETLVHRLVDRLLAYLPDLIHVIIISREVPPLALARLRSQASLTTIDRAELLFTDAETQQLFRKVFDLELTSKQLIEYRERTHGWITALQLVRQVAQRQALTENAGRDREASELDLVEILRQSERDIFDYFAEEVFADEPEEIKYLLLRVALLDRIEIAACNHLFAELNCPAALTALVRGNVFMTVASDERGEEYRLHPLFREFLRRRLRAEIGHAGAIAEHARFADYFLSAGAWEQAMRHLLAAEDYERAASIIAGQGSAWISAGALSSLLSFAQAVPSAILEAHPRALAARAEVARLRGEYDAAQSQFRHAVELLRQNGDREGEAEALHSLATIARRRGDFETAFAYLDRAVELTSERSAVRIKCGNTRGLCLMVSGDLAAAEREFRAALQFAEEQGKENYVRLIAHNLGLPAMLRGDFGQALHWLRRLLSEDAKVSPAPRDATAHLNIARAYFYRGEMDSCEQHLDHAIELSQLFSLSALRGEIFEAYGNLYRERGEIPRATEFYERAARAHDEAGVDLTQYELLEEQAMLLLRTGEIKAAREKIDRLINARARARNKIGEHTAALVRGRISLAQDDHKAASADLKPALQFFREHALNYYEAQASIGLARCSLAEGKDGQMLQHLRRALDLAARYDYEFWLQNQVEHYPELFAPAEAADLLPADLRERLAIPVAPKAPLVSAPTKNLNVASHAVTDLQVKMLGPVEIFRDPARPLAADAWTTKRARDILCYIASRRHRRASKDTIIDVFWGEQDFEVVEKNFHPTISHIRKALNSNQPLKQNFLLYRDGDYQLNPEFNYSIDTEEFDRLNATGDTARRARDYATCVEAFEQAIALYRGEFMRGVYDDWAEEQRSYYREQYLRMLESLAAAAQKEQEWSRSLQLAQRILQEDPFREDIHCMILRAHAALGNRAALKEQYDSLRRLLRKELGVEPVAETQRVYHELMR